MTNDSTELVVLVDDIDKPIGTAPKASVHTTDTPLHRAFSLFVFNSAGAILLTQRAKNKKTFPGVWTNTACGHPGPDETRIDAAKRRLVKELGITSEVEILEVAPYRYRFADAGGTVENEICPVFIAYFDGDPHPDTSEVNAWKWMAWKTFLTDLASDARIYSPWCREEALLVAAYLQKNGST